MTSNSTRKTAQVVALTALAAAVAGATLSATANSTRTYPTMTFPVRTVQTYQQPAYGFHRYTQGTLRTTYVSGGATLPAIGYMGLPAKTNNPSTPAAGSVMGYFNSVLSGNHTTVQYCQTGSGAGKKIFNGTTVNGTNLACAAIGSPPNGFGAPQVGTGFPISWPDMDASDSPMSQSEYGAFTTNRGTVANGTEAVELPEIGGAIALFYNNPDTGTTQIHLTDANICGMVLGTITNWSQLGFASRPLSFAYRSDGSGTTFGFSNHLTAVCHSASITNTQQFTGTALVCSASPFCVVNTAPACSIAGGCGASGNQGVTNLIAGNVGTIGYVEAANAHDSLNTAKGINYALVNGKDPLKNLPENVVKLNGTTSVVKDSVVVIAQGKEATTAALSPAPVHAGCVVLVKPSAYANLSTGYPIWAVSYQLYAYSGNGANNARLRTLAQELTKSGIVYNNQAGTKNITTVDASTSTPGTGTTGFANLPSSFQTPVKTASNACINS